MLQTNFPCVLIMLAKPVYNLVEQEESKGMKGMNTLPLPFVVISYVTLQGKPLPISSASHCNAKLVPRPLIFVYIQPYNIICTPKYELKVSYLFFHFFIESLPTQNDCACHSSATTTIQTRTLFSIHRISNPPEVENT